MTIEAIATSVRMLHDRNRAIQMWSRKSNRHPTHRHEHPTDKSIIAIACALCVASNGLDQLVGYVWTDLLDLNKFIDLNFMRIMTAVVLDC